VLINTNYNTDLSKDTDYGDLFISTDGWNPNGTAENHYLLDDVSTGEDWEYILDTSDSTMYANDKSSDFIALSDNVYKGTGNYRKNQEVQRGTGGTAIDGNSLVDLSSVNNTHNYSGSNNAGIIRYVVDLASIGGYSFGQEIGVRWQMTCANDIIEGSVRAAEPTTLALLGLGLIGFGFSRRSLIEM
jgi:hypothetical protein